MSHNELKRITNLHVIDSSNVGDLFASPLKYFDFPGYDCSTEDIRTVTKESVANSHLIVGGGGLLFKRFLPQFQTIHAAKDKGKCIVWGAGYQIYGRNPKALPGNFDFSSYLSGYDLVGLRDDQTPYEWVPCASCMHPSFDKPRTPEHEVIVFSHKKFQLDISGFPTLANKESNFDTVLDFLGSGETILTSSFHGAYWGTLLGRRVIAFPFSSKFFTLRHPPALYPVKEWSQFRWKLSVSGRHLFSIKHGGEVLKCNTQGWQQYLKDAPVYPNLLEEYRERSRWFYRRLMDILST